MPADGKRVVVTRSTLGLGAELPGDRFGAAVSTPFDDDEDGCSDVVVGAPGAEGTGVVYVVLGSPQGFTKARTVRLPGGRAGDEFGYSVSVGLWHRQAYYYVVVGARDATATEPPTRVPSSASAFMTRSAP